MRDISAMATVLTNKLEQKLEKLKEAQRETAKAIWADTINEAPMTEDNYISSIQISDTKEEKDVIKTSVFSDLIVYWRKKNINVPLAAFLEWGIGPMGEDSNNYPHGYPYTTDSPWDAYSFMQMQQTGTWGREARPHFYPALQKNVALYKENLRKALKEE